MAAPQLGTIVHDVQPRQRSELPSPLARRQLMFAVIAWALSTSTAAGSNSEQLNWLLANPWGIVSRVDLYVGFSVYSIWICFGKPTSLVAALRRS